MTNAAFEGNDTKREVFLFNFGGPTQEKEVEPFLLKLFEDPFIIRAPLGTFLRKHLAKYISKKRWQKTNAQYQQIGYSPINRYTDAQAMQLEARLRKIHPETKVHVINRYTAPYADDVIAKITAQKESNSRYFLISMYPHFCHSTTASSIRDFDQAWERVTGEKSPVSTRIYSWWWHPSWMDWMEKTLKNQIQNALQENPHKNLTVLYSAHGVPQKYTDRGDPYWHEVRAQVDELSRRCKSWLSTLFPNESVTFDLCFQSRVGPVKWLRPYAEDAIRAYASSRKDSLLLVPVSFVSDHIETLFEMDVTYRNDALSAGFSKVYRCPVPNDQAVLADSLAAILTTHGF